MIWEIKKPKWHSLGIVQFEWVKALDNWFEENVTPINKMLAEGVEVYSNEPTRMLGTWTKESHSCTHKALLINIQLIKKETAEDVLRGFVLAYETIHSGATRTKTEIDCAFDDVSNLHKRAKAVLEKE